MDLSPLHKSSQSRESTIVIYDCCNSLPDPTVKCSVYPQPEFPALRFLLQMNGEVVILSSKLGTPSYFYPGSTTLFTSAFHAASNGDFNTVQTLSEDLNYRLAGLYRESNITWDNTIIEVYVESKKVALLYFHRPID